MQSRDQDKLLFLVRAAPGSDAAAQALANAGNVQGAPGRALTVFFHGPGVLHARDESAQAWTAIAADRPLQLKVCAAAWQRRSAQPVPEPFESSTLIQFWHLALAGVMISCYGSSDEG